VKFFKIKRKKVALFMVGKGMIAIFAINLCEMKFSVGPFVIKKSYAKNVREK